MFQITLLFLYVAAAAGFALSRLPNWAKHERILSLAGFFLTAIAIVLHARLLWLQLMQPGLALPDVLSLIGIELGVIALVGAFAPSLRGLSAGLLLLAAVTAAATGSATDHGSMGEMSMQLRAHILSSMVAYGLLTVGAIVAISALFLEKRLRSARLSVATYLCAPLMTTEKLLYGITAAGFTLLLVAIISGATFIENLFAQHLVHKTALALLALILFGVLLLGRWLAGWRGRRAVILYLAGYAILVLAYFGSRIILEEFLGRSWG